MLQVRFYPDGNSGDVRDYLETLRTSAQTKKAALRLDLDIKILAEYWPKTLNVSVRTLGGWEPLREIRRRFDRIAYRIFFCIRADELWLLSAYEKESEDAPRNELEKAYGRMRAVLEGRA